MFILLEKLDSSGSNSTPHPGKVQILHLPALYLSLLSCKKIQLGDVTWISKKPNTSTNALSEKKKKNSEKGQWFSLLRNISQFFFQSINWSLFIVLTLAQK